MPYHRKKCQLHISSNSRKWGEIKKFQPAFQKAVGAVFDELKISGMEDAEINFLLTHDKHIQKLNAQHRGKNKPTNVLSFQYLTIEQAKKNTKQKIPAILGDVIIAYETCFREAKEHEKYFAHHLTHLVVHSILHILGYDHIENDEAEKMETLEIKILKKLKIKNPYLIN